MSEATAHPRSGAASVRWGRAAAAMVIALTALNWVGWATGNALLTRVHPAWPPMAPWAALLLGGLAAAALLQSGRPSPARLCVGRGVAVLAGVIALVFLAEYVTGHRFGIDQLWFGDAVAVPGYPWPGRPAPQTALSALFLAIGVALTRVDGKWIPTAWTFALLSAAATPWVTMLSYLFEDIGFTGVSATGMALIAAVGLLLNVIATLSARTDRDPAAWIFARPNRVILLRLNVIVVSFPFFVGLSRQAFLGLGAGEGTALTFSTAVGTVVVGATMIHLGRREQKLLDAVESDRALLRAVTDAMIDPQMLFEPKRDAGGRITDFTFAEANPAACAYLGLPRADLIGASLSEMFPNIAESGLLTHYVRCAQTGEPVVLGNFPFFNGILNASRYYDIRGARSPAGFLSVNYRDVTDQHETQQRLAASEEHYRLLAENAADIICHVREGELLWVSESVEAVLGKPPEYWLGQDVLAHVPPEQVENLAAWMRTVDEGGTVQERMKALGADGVVHWLDLHARPFLRADGRQDGVAASLRLVDDEVAAEQQAKAAHRQLEEARIKGAESAALQRGVIDNSIVATALSDLQGRFVTINQAMCDLVGYDAASMRQMTWQDITAPEFLDADIAALPDIISGKTPVYRVRKQYLHADGHRVWGDMATSVTRGPEGEPQYFIAQILDITSEMEARRQQARADALYRRSMESAAVGMCLADVEGTLVEVNDALCKFFGYDAEHLQHMTWQELTAADYLQADLDQRAGVLAGKINSYRLVKEFIHADGHPIWGDLSVSCIRAADGQVEVFIGQIIDITTEVEGREQLKKARRQQARSDALYRRSMESAAVGMCLTTPEGRFTDVNDALCDFFGYGPEILKKMTWQQLSAPEYLEADLFNVGRILSGQMDSYRLTKQFIHADGHRIWGDLSVSCLREPDGDVERLIAQVSDITTEVALAEELQRQTELTKAELDSAASYMSSIMPPELQDPIAVSSRYLPSQQLGGDCFDYRWIDDDHLVVYLLDVSGHGLEPALLAVSLQNMLRSGSLSTATLKNPAAVLDELNRLFQMEMQSDHYFTIWYGVYDNRTRTMLYASAGAPPAYAFSAGTAGVPAATELTTNSSPVGVFGDTEFTASAYSVPHGCRILLYSDGASEQLLANGDHLSLEEFKELTTRLAGSPNWSLEDLIGELRNLTPAGVFEDDCSLIQLTFD